MDPVYKNKTETFGVDPRLFRPFIFAASLQGLDKSEAVREALALWMKQLGITKGMMFTLGEEELRTLIQQRTPYLGMSPEEIRAEMEEEAAFKAELEEEARIDMRDARRDAEDAARELV